MEREDITLQRDCLVSSGSLDDSFLERIEVQVQLGSLEERMRAIREKFRSSEHYAELRRKEEVSKVCLELYCEMAKGILKPVEFGNTLLRMEEALGYQANRIPQKGDDMFYLMAISLFYNNFKVECICFFGKRYAFKRVDLGVDLCQWFTLTSIRCYEKVPHCLVFCRNGKIVKRNGVRAETPKVFAYFVAQSKGLGSSDLAIVTSTIAVLDELTTEKSGQCCKPSGASSLCIEHK